MSPSLQLFTNLCASFHFFNTYVNYTMVRFRKTVVDHSQERVVVVYLQLKGLKPRIISYVYLVLWSVRLMRL